ncbi:MULTISPECIES: NAD(P)/FAD-dependent oxidoreductase [unclassified Caballeronia]|jgi:NADH:ubiquinone reductase (H+-translocating)|uniref:NAD(P)/FAD-dependent oxidoreductase n=1 Tax=unclassified Caballeronia TaxID=2646786 RepID=UPI0020283D21|nr:MULTISPECIES: NAD(P)/FAD-dependent oxidoreductase [unclassified Caballeronia]MDR5794866.1 NAD(P)/FAD-dependent oxidoreductase [Caballeronia sp. LZ008]
MMLNPYAQRQVDSPHRIVIVGGGAAGLELATRLGNSVGKRRRAEVILIDRFPTHFWKPLLHEVASGQIDASSHQIDYAAHAKWNHFRFEQGALANIDRGRREIVIDETTDIDGRPLLPKRTLAFDSLVLALGSVTNFFSIPGAAQHALTLETVEQAETFRRRLLSSLLRSSHARQATPGAARTPVSVTVIGGGATGVELAAALRGSAEMLREYHLASIDPASDIRIRLLEGAPRVLPALPERISTRAQDVLAKLGVEVRLGCRVRSVDEQAVSTADGETLTSDITIWAAGVEGAPVLRTLEGLPLNRLGQVIVDATLQVEPGSGIYAMGDCAACAAAKGDALVPPRAQAAFQQAVYLADALARRLDERAVPLFAYRDQGTLVSFGRAGAAGALMSELLRRPLFIDGWFAASCYRHLYRRHIMGLTGVKRALMYAASQWLRERVRPTVKLN